jgi:hypothetical protein
LRGDAERLEDSPGVIAELPRALLVPELGVAIEARKSDRVAVELEPGPLTVVVADLTAERAEAGARLLAETDVLFDEVGEETLLHSSIVTRRSRRASRRRGQDEV